MTNDDHYEAPEVSLPMVSSGAEIVKLNGQLVLALKEENNDVAYLSEWFLEDWLWRLREAKGNEALAVALREVGR